MGLKGGSKLNWMEMTLQEFQSKLASKSPTPGGGTASAVALGQSAALVAMVSNLTIGNEKWKEGWQASESPLEVANNTMDEAAILATADSDAFDRVMDSFKMAKNTDEEKQNRRNEIRNSTLHAAEIPYRTANLSLSILEQMKDLSLHANANAISDVGVAALLASAACKGALFNVEINLNSLPEDYGVEMRENLDKINEKCRELSKVIMHNVKTRL